MAERSFARDESPPPAAALGDQPVRRRLRRVVERQLADLGSDDLVLVGVSGGADSLALARLVADISADRGLIRAGAIVVDHQLQGGSAEVAAAAVRTCLSFGLAPVVSHAVEVDRSSAAGGLEAGARTARRRAMISTAHQLGAKAILLAHTIDDQAETVLLGLARGSGSRSLAAMSEHDGLWRRPLLGATRSDTVDICAQAGLTPYDDPHNQDPAFTRVKVRTRVLPTLEQELGPGIREALARTASMLQQDNAALDQWAQLQAESRLELTEEGRVQLALTTAESGKLATIPQAVRMRLYRLALLAVGVTPGSITFAHLTTVDRFVADWRGQGPTRVPGDHEVARISDSLVFYRAQPLGR
jgi:tRNA(Ile)-lysidine synthase